MPDEQAGRDIYVFGFLRLLVLSRRTEFCYVTYMICCLYMSGMVLLCHSGTINCCLSIEMSGLVKVFACYQYVHLGSVCCCSNLFYYN